MILKLLPIVAPFIIYLIINILKSYLSSAHKNTKNKDAVNMVSCSKCGTFVHESLVINKYNKSFCSSECLNS